MLRRAPTTLQITSEDVAAYEDRRAREALIAAQQQQQQQQQREKDERGGGGGGDQQRQQHAMEGVQESPGAAARRAREERIGVAGRRGGR